MRLVNSLRSFSDLGGRIVRNKVVFTFVDTSGVITKKNATNQCKFRIYPQSKNSKVSCSYNACYIEFTGHNVG